jgi:SH3 domain protein
MALPLAETTAGAETRYVVDQLVITLRQGKSTEYKILKTLKTGTPVEVLEEGDTYLKVRTADGTEGYVLRQYITADPPSILLVNELKRKNSELEKAKNDLQGQLEEVQAKYVREFSQSTQKIAALEHNLQQAVENESAITEKYSTLSAESENILQTTEERDALRRENGKLQSANKELQRKNEKISDTRMIKWFLAGGGVFFFGWLIGKISRKRRTRF